MRGECQKGGDSGAPLEKYGTYRTLALLSAPSRDFYRGNCQGFAHFAFPGVTKPSGSMHTLVHTAVIGQAKIVVSVEVSTERDHPPLCAQCADSCKEPF